MRFAFNSFSLRSSFERNGEKPIFFSPCLCAVLHYAALKNGGEFKPQEKPIELPFSRSIIKVKRLIILKLQETYFHKSLNQ